MARILKYMACIFRLLLSKKNNNLQSRIFIIYLTDFLQRFYCHHACPFKQL